MFTQRRWFMHLALLSTALLLGCSDPAETPRDAGPADRGAEAAQDAGADAVVADSGDDGGDGPASDQSAPATGWALSAGGAAGQDVGMKLATDSKGNIYVAGYFSSSATFGSTTLSGSPHETFLFKLDKQGLPQWAKALGDLSLGAVLGGPGLAVDAQDNVYVAGAFTGTLTLGSKTLTSAGSVDLLVVKLDGAGKVLWTAAGGGAKLDYGVDLAVDAAGYATVTGQFMGSATFGSTTLSAQASPPAPDGGPPPADMGGPPPPPPPDLGAPVDAGPPPTPMNMFVARLAPTGSFVWAVASARPFGRRITADKAGKLYLTGYFMSTASFGASAAFTRAAYGFTDMFAARLDPKDGSFAWVTSSGQTNDGSKGYGITTDAAGEVYVSGSFGGTTSFGGKTYKVGLGQGGNDMFVARLKPADGSFVWLTHAGGLAMTSARGLTADGAGNVYVTGYHWGSATVPATFGADKLVAVGTMDAYVSKLDATGSFVWARSGGSAGQEKGQDVALGGAGEVLVTGFFGYPQGGTGTFGATKLASQGSSDVFVWRVE